MTRNRPYDWACDGDFAVETTERPGVYEEVSDTTRRGLWNEQSRLILDEAIAKVHADDAQGAADLIDAFVARFNRRYGSVHTAEELRLR
jgi:hypothetical protein